MTRRSLRARFAYGRVILEASTQIIPFLRYENGGGIKRRKKTVSCEASLHFEPKTSRDWRFRDILSPERAPTEHQKNQFYVSNSECGLVHHEKTTRKHDTFKTGLVWSTRRMRHQWEIHDRLADSYTFWSFESQKLQVLN